MRIYIREGKGLELDISNIKSHLAYIETQWY